MPEAALVGERVDPGGCPECVNELLYRRAHDDRAPVLRDDLDAVSGAVPSQHVHVGGIGVGLRDQRRAVDVRALRRRRRAERLCPCDVERALLPRAQPCREPNRAVEDLADGARARPNGAFGAFDRNARHRGIQHRSSVRVESVVLIARVSPEELVASHQLPEAPPPPKSPPPAENPPLSKSSLSPPPEELATNPAAAPVQKAEFFMSALAFLEPSRIMR